MRKFKKPKKKRRRQMSIKIDLKIFLFIVLFYFTKQIEIYMFLMIFALIHELSHLICGLALKFKPNSIKINPCGFQISFLVPADSYNENKKINLSLKKITIALAGPITNLIISFVCLIVPIFNNETVIYANILLAIFNLLPIYPLDGGRILQEVVKMRKGNQKSYEVTNLVAKTTVILLTIISSIAILYIHNFAIIIILLYLWYLVIQNEKYYSMKKNIYKQVEKLRKKDSYDDNYYSNKI